MSLLRERGRIPALGDSVGRDLVKAQRALGHCYIESTAAYISLRQEEVDEGSSRSECAP